MGRAPLSCNSINTHDFERIQEKYINKERKKQCTKREDRRTRPCDTLMYDDSSFMKCIQKGDNSNRRTITIDKKNISIINENDLRINLFYKVSLPKNRSRWLQGNHVSSFVKVVQSYLQRYNIDFPKRFEAFANKHQLFGKISLENIVDVCNTYKICMLLYSYDFEKQWLLVKSTECTMRNTASIFIENNAFGILKPKNALYNYKNNPILNPKAIRSNSNLLELNPGILKDAIQENSKNDRITFRPKSKRYTNLIEYANTAKQNGNTRVNEIDDLIDVVQQRNDKNRFTKETGTAPLFMENILTELNSMQPKRIMSSNNNRQRNNSSTRNSFTTNNTPSETNTKYITAKKNKTPDSNNKDKTPDSNKKNKTPDSNKKNKTPDSNNKDKTPDSNKKNKTPDSNKKNKTPDSNKTTPYPSRVADMIKRFQSNE